LGQRSLSGSFHHHASRSSAAAYAKSIGGRLGQNAVESDPQLGSGDHRRRLMRLGGSIRSFLAVLCQQPQSFVSLPGRRSSAQQPLKQPTVQALTKATGEGAALKRLRHKPLPEP
jgi:hypothetical protein